MEVTFIKDKVIYYEVNPSIPHYRSENILVATSTEEFLRMQKILNEINQMPNFKELYDLATDEVFEQRVLIAMVKTATFIVGEPFSEGDAFTKRHALGVDVLNHPVENMNKFKFAVVAPGTITDTATDGDIEYMVVTVFNDIAGVRIDDV